MNDKDVKKGQTTYLVKAINPDEPKKDKTFEDIKNGDLGDTMLKMIHEKPMFSPLQKQELLNNGRPENSGKNHNPVACIRVTRFGYTFLVTELYEDEPDIAFGLCDYDTKLKFDKFSLKKIEKDLEPENPIFSKNFDFYAKYPVGVYAQVAQSIGTVVIETNERLIKPLFENFSKSKWSDKSLRVSEFKF